MAARLRVRRHGHYTQKPWQSQHPIMPNEPSMVCSELGYWGGNSHVWTLVYRYNDMARQLVRSIQAS